MIGGVLALVLAIMVFASMAVPAMAVAATHTITLNSDDTHTYKIFQVLTGTLSEEGSSELGDPEWGADAADDTASIEDFIDSITDDTLTEKEIAELVLAAVNTTGDGQGTVDKDHPKSGLATGYYVLKDVTDADTLKEENGEYSLYVVKVVNDVNGFTVKYDTTSDDKVIVSDSLGTDNATKDNNTVYEEGVNDGKIDDVSIGDAVNYQITAKIPSTTGNYDFYYFIINDTLSKGLTLDPDSIKVYHTSVDPTNLIDAASENGYTKVVDDKIAEGEENEGEQSFHIGMKNAKAYNDEKIIVTYTATLNADAIIGENGNPNTSTVTYSNNPHDEYDGTQDDTKPGFPAEDETPSLGETPVTQTWTFSTQIKLRKVDADGNPLVGAKFTLTGNSVQTVLVMKSAFVKSGDEGYVAANANTHYLLKDGTYTDANPIADHYDVIGVGDENTTVGLLKRDGVEEYYTPEDASEYNGKTIYKFVKGNQADYASEKIYQKIEAEVQKLDSTVVDKEAEVDGEGYVTFVGLGAGEYTIAETQTPAGYNTIENDLVVDIDFTAKPVEGAKHWTIGSNTTKDSSNNYVFSYVAADEAFEAEIVNNKGTELPSTGGIGTTIFYVAGSILVLAAAILLITKRRMGAQD